MLVFHKPRNLKTFNKGDIADWIQEIQNEMYHSVKRRIKDLYVSQQKLQSIKKDWVTQHNCQAVCVTSMLMWTDQTEYAI